MPNSRREIFELFTRYNIIPDDSLTSNDAMQWIIRNLQNSVAFECPDAYMEYEKIVYGIEHFQVSMYNSSKKGDIARKADGTARKRDKIPLDKDYEEFDLEPSINNLLNQLSGALKTHSKSFNEYKRNLNAIQDSSNNRLILLIEDRSDPGYIVSETAGLTEKHLRFRQIAEILLQYKDDIWGILISSGNDQTKNLSGCLLAELQEEINKNSLLDITDYEPFEKGRKRQISRKGVEDDEDEHLIIIKNYLFR